MDWNYAHRTPVFRIVLVIIIFTAWSMPNATGAFFSFMALCLGLLFLAPVLGAIRSVGLKKGWSTWTRRSCMLFPVMLVLVPLFLETNSYGGHQRSSLKLSLHGKLPDNLEVVSFKSLTGIDGALSFDAFLKCEGRSLREILGTEPFQNQGDPNGEYALKRAQAYLNSKRILSLPAASHWITYSNSSLARKSAKDHSSVSVVTDKTFEWAYVYYSSGD
jgi:hypothetical protein